MQRTHAFRRFLHWRRGVPALRRGALHPSLPDTLIDFIPLHDGQRVLAPCLPPFGTLCNELEPAAAADALVAVPSGG